MTAVKTLLMVHIYSVATTLEQKLARLSVFCKHYIYLLSFVQTNYSKMNLVSFSFEKGFKFTLYLTLLVTFFILYFPDMVEKYQKRAKTYTTKEISTSSEDLPTITICVGFKPSIINDTFGRNFNYFVKMRYLKEIEGRDMEELYNKASYQYYKDFKIKYGQKHGWFLKEGEQNYSDFDTVKLRPYNTKHRGKCYALSLIEAKSIRQIKIIFKPHLQGEDLPTTVQLYITPKNTSKNVIWSKWSPIRPLVVPLKLGEPTASRILLSATEWRFHEGNEKCTNGCLPDECFSLEDLKALHKEMKETSTGEKWNFEPCIPVPLKHFFDPSLMPCANRKRSELMLTLFNQQEDKIVECPKPKAEKQYQAIIMDGYRREPEETAVTFYVDFRYSSMTVKEETLIYDTLSFIGTFGGFLGLFVGFSFFGFCTDFCFGILRRIFKSR